ncbi:MAG TPA: hypothetical protein VHB27_00950 [Rhodopila sp.]|uniref:hypothetical protein n=1 Tax=Rhodopila sp. TaxID=2480087 RepID=UPI002C8DD3FA|nr:hypothetical protein [Rhodopila sp.]HVY13764.1 hypothetical protein [Rhodopila sp.]
MRLKRHVSSQLSNGLTVGGAALVAALLVAGAGKVARDPVSVGDIITFEPDPGAITTVSTLPSGRIAAHRPDQYGCILDLDTLRRFGGSLVTEARLASEGQSYRLHWAGERTAPDSGDCGSSADLILSRRDLNRLAAAGGGSIMTGMRSRIGRTDGEQEPGL